MVLQLFGLIAIVVATIFVFKTARENGRNAALWAFINVVIGIAAQIVLPVIVGVILAIYLITTGTRAEMVNESIGSWAIVLTIGSLALSFVGMFLVIRHVAQIPDDDVVDADAGPPPPPTFDQG